MTSTEARPRPAITLPEYRLGQPPPNKGKRYPPQPLTRAEVNRLLAVCSRRSTSGIRMAAMIAVLWRAGLRIAELLDLFPWDVDLEAGTVHVQRGKGDKDRLAGIDPEACALVERWLTRRASLGIPRSRGGEPTRLFCTYLAPEPGRPLWHTYVRERLHELAAKAGVEKRCNPHAFRHTHAYELRMEGRDLSVIKDQLGHSRLDTTERYISHLAPAERIALLRARQWDGPDATAATGPVDVHAEIALLRALVEELRAG